MIFSDSIGNFFAGEIRYGNFNINTPTGNFLVGDSISQFSQILGALFDELATETSIIEVIQNSVLENWSIATTSKTLLKFSIGSNTYSFRKNIFVGGLQFSQVYFPVELHNVAQISNTVDHSISDSIDKINFTAVLNENSLALLLFETKAGGNNLEFFYAGRTSITNSSYNYYTSDPKSNAILLHCKTESGGFPLVSSKHFVAETQKPLLQTGNAASAIVCENGTIPSQQWATDFIVFDNNSALNYPAIGKLDNLLLATGSYEFLKPIKLITAPDAGSNVWLPVGTYAGKTLLMRCYSTF